MTGKLNSLRHVLIVLAVSALGLAVILWATLGESDLQRRVNWTIEELQQHSPGNPGIVPLKAATPQSLRTPELVWARIMDQPESVVLMVNWIEAKPTVDGVRITCEETGFSSTIAVEGWRKRSNSDDAERFVYFGAYWKYAKDDTTWLAVKNAMTRSPCQLVLLRQGAEVSNVMELDWRRAGSFEKLPDT
ncbi:MAG: hypothetical protein QGG25_10760, partial [Phycisphaerae bacterium]|nr:hypothetical protein [Phycisphaerae bacterium]